MSPRFYLLTHSREHKKNSNTGRLVSSVLKEQCQIITWQRKEPSIELLTAIDKGDIALVYPDLADESVRHIKLYSAYILLDGTWQEARKMYNQSPYLKRLPRVTIDPGQESRYTLRRNQKMTGLCTAECVVEILDRSGCNVQSATLNDLFTCFLEQNTSRGAGAAPTL